MSMDSAERARERRRAEWKELLACPGARNIIGEMIYNALAARSFSPIDAAMTAYNEGRRSVGLALIDQIEAVHPGAVAEMIKHEMESIRNERSTGNDADEQ